MRYIQDDLAKCGPDVVLLRIVQCDTTFFRIRIVSSPNHFRCSAIVEVWHQSRLQWNPVTEIPYGSMQTPLGIADTPDWQDLSRFEEDYDYLLGMAMMLLGKA